MGFLERPLPQQHASLFEEDARASSGCGGANRTLDFHRLRVSVIQTDGLFAGGQRGVEITRIEQPTRLVKRRLNPLNHTRRR
jgi:hypothetical protein